MQNSRNHAYVPFTIKEFKNRFATSKRETPAARAIITARNICLITTALVVDFAFEILARALDAVGRTHRIRIRMRNKVIKYPWNVTKIEVFSLVMNFRSMYQL